MRKAFLLLLIALLAVPVGRAQVEDESTDTEPEVSEPERKHPSFWHRPEEQTPELQLAYAQELEARGAKKKAAKHFRALVHQWHESPQAVEAQSAYCRLLEERGKYVRAFDEYQYMIDFYPLRINYNEILERQFAIANLVMTERRMTLFVFKGFAAPDRALTLFERLVRNAPGWSRAPEAQFRVGWIHEEMQDFDEAVTAYGTLLHRYRNSEFAEQATFRRAYCLYEVAKSSPRDEVACRTALSALATYLSKSRGSEEDIAAAGKYRQELKTKLAAMYYERARFYDRTGRPEAAVLSYREFVKKFPDDPLAGEATARMEDLTPATEQKNEEK